MAKTYIKKKKNTLGPKYRTPSRLVGGKFSGKRGSQRGFTPQTFKKTQHKG